MALRWYGKAQEHVKVHTAATRLQMFCRRWYVRRKAALKKERRELYKVKPERKEPTRQEKCADVLGGQVQSIQNDTKITQYHSLLGKCTRIVDNVSFFGEEQIINGQHLFEGMCLGGRVIMLLQDQSTTGRTEAGVCYLGYRKRTRHMKGKPNKEPVIRTWNVIFVGVTRRDQRSGRVTTTEMPATSVLCPNQCALVSEEMKAIVQRELHTFIKKISPPPPVPVKPVAVRVKDVKAPTKQPAPTRVKQESQPDKPRRVLNDYVLFNREIQAYLDGLSFAERTKRVSEVFSIQRCTCLFV